MTAAEKSPPTYRQPPQPCQQNRTANAMLEEFLLTQESLPPSPVIRIAAEIGGIRRYIP